MFLKSRAKSALDIDWRGNDPRPLTRRDPKFQNKNIDM